MTCNQCGAPTKTVCGCGSPICPKHTFFYVDESNAAINKAARPECVRCHPPKYVRPFTLVRALERGEWHV